jgi:hypothetical protein
MKECTCFCHFKIKVPREVASEIVKFMYHQIEFWEPEEAPEEDIDGVMEILTKNKPCGVCHYKHVEGEK